MKKFKLNVTVSGYTSKEEITSCLSSEGAKKIGKSKIAFQERELTISEFLDLAVTGHAFCGLFQVEDKDYWINGNKINPFYKRGINSGAMKISFKKDEYFKSSQVIFIDIDKTSYTSIDSFVENLSIQPTAAYYTFSDKPDNRKFRLVYVFDNQMNYDDLKKYTYSINRKIEEETGELIQDKCNQKPSQYFNGTNIRKVFNYGNVYSTSMIDLYEMPVEEVKGSSDKVVEIDLSSKLLWDMANLDYDNFMKYNRRNYNYTYRSEDSVWNNGEWQETKSDSFTLYFNTSMIQDGSKRRKKIYERMCLRRVMNPDITPDTVLFCAYEDVHRFVDNSDGVFTADLLAKNVRSAFNLTIPEIEEKYSESLSYLRSNSPKLIFKKGVVSSVSEMHKKMKEINYSKISQYYDSDLSIIQNQKALKIKGISVSRVTLYRYCAENNISTTRSKELEKEMIIDNYNESLSLRDNVAYFKGMGISVSKDKLSRIMKEFNKENESKEPVVEEVKPVEEETIEKPIVNNYSLDFTIPTINGDNYKVSDDDTSKDWKIDYFKKSPFDLNIKFTGF